MRVSRTIPRNSYCVLWPSRDEQDCRGVDVEARLYQRYATQILINLRLTINYYQESLRAFLYILDPLDIIPCLLLIPMQQLADEA
jgi:hypothetical protein